MEEINEYGPEHRIENQVRNILFLIKANDGFAFSNPHNFLSLLQYHLRKIDELQTICTGDKSEREIRLRISSARELVRQITEGILQNNNKR